MKSSPRSPLTDSRAKARNAGCLANEASDLLVQPYNGMTAYHVSGALETFLFGNVSAPGVQIWAEVFDANDTIDFSVD